MNKIDAKDSIEKLAGRFDYHVEGYNNKEQLKSRIQYTDPKKDK